MKKTTLLIILLFTYSITHIIGQTSATYDITFTSIWNATDHTSVPVNAHWSKLVGATHKTTNVFLQIDNLATTGIKNIAETGNNDVFNTEVTAEITKGEADQYIDGPNLDTATGDILISDLVIKEEFPLLTLVSMIAPSPDWMIALNSYNLLDTGGKWKTLVNLDMFAYDAGTDSGTDYTSNNSITNPFLPISMINGSPFYGKKIGTLTITLKAVLDISDFSLYNKVDVYPNPLSNGKIIIRNLEGITINKVEIYNISGLLIKSSDKKTYHNTFTFDTQDLTSGIYILKLTVDKNKMIIRKFVID